MVYVCASLSEEEFHKERVGIALFTRGVNKDELEALFTSHLKLDRDLAAHITIIIRSVST